MCSLSQRVDGGDEAAGTREEGVSGYGLFVGLTPRDGFGMFLCIVACGLAVGDEPLQEGMSVVLNISGTFGSRARTYIWATCCE